MKTIRKVVVVLLVLAAVAGAGHFGIRAYVSLRQGRLVRQAKEYLAKPDEKKALLCLQRALRHNSRDVAACRLMAELAEKAGSPAALIWRSRVVELAPRSLDDRLTLARAALALRDLASATNALAGVRQPDQQTSAFHNTAGAVAAAAGQTAQAETHFLEASRLDPTNPAPRLSLAVLRLEQTNAQAVAEARATLQQLSAKPECLCQALRGLIADAMRYDCTKDALALSSDLLNQTNSAFSDRLLRLEVLRVSKDPALGKTLAAFQKDAGSDPAKIQQLATW